ncbi:hypothetical protein FQ775_00995 [Nitratireductor mangrovi]|uniref:Bacteriophage tail tape measure N-terminal domain-containing protein n=1 Tax=Nitratireductor mangrovi TaxID=2599600 RepID=A0A5B8KU04_9HYPH|nr:phage tail length tape measure family protein [Nitratireductor mangrovi]QDY99058.1 hypothetical protein FQ775_00995 [Nitratireductor mangrovi]
MAGQPLKLSMVMTADNSDLAATTRSTRREIEGVGTTARSTSGDMDRLAAANNAAAEAGRRAAEAARGQSAAENALRSSIAGLVRPESSAADLRRRQADIDAYGASLDRLRAKFNPVFAASKMYEAELDELNRAHALGAINADEHGAALTTLNARYQMNAEAARHFARDARMGAMQVGNLAFQVQDIGMMMAMGQSPFMLLAQQLPQVTMHGGSLRDALAGIRQTLGGLVSPLGLATTAFVLLGSTAISYATGAEEEVETLSDVLERHEAIIKSLGPAYEDALRKAREYSTDPEVAEVLLRGAVRDAEAALKKEITEALRLIDTEIRKAAFDVVSEGMAASLDQAAANTRFGPFLELIEQFRAGKLDAREFRDEVARIGSSTEGLETVSKELTDIAAAAVEAEIAVKGLPDSVDQLDHAFKLLQAAINEVRSDNAREEIQELKDRAEEGELSIDEVRAALGNLSGVSPDLSNAIAELMALFDQAIATRDAVDDVMRGGGTGGPRRYSRGVNTRVDRYEVDLPDSAPAPSRRVDPYFADASPRRGSRKTEAERDAERYRDLIRSAEQYIDLQELEREALYLTEEAAAALRYEQNLLNQAVNAGIGLTPAQVQELGVLAEEMARVEAETRAAAEAMAFQRDILDGALSDLRSALDDGKITWEELGDIALNVIDKIIDKIEDELIDALLRMMDSGGGGIWGGILGLLTGFFGGGDPWAGLRGHSEGGYTGSGGKFEPAGVVHRGEYVFSSEATDAIGVGNLDALHSTARRGFAVGGYAMPMATAAPAFRPRQEAEWIGVNRAGHAGSTQINVFNVETPNPRAFAESRAVVARTADRFARRLGRYT